MPKATMKGAISFGLVSIPVLFYSVENKEVDIHFHLIDKRDNERIHYQRINSSTGKVVPWEQITRGYQYDKETVIPVPDEILNKVSGGNARVIDIETFVDKEQLDLLSMDHIYYLTPDKKGEKGYVILREALAASHKIGIAKVIISTKEYLAALIPHAKGLILCLLKYDKEVRKMSELDFPDKEISQYKIHKGEVEIAKKLIKSMSSKWRPEKYEDDYQKSIHQWVEEAIRNIPHKTKKKKAVTEKAKTADFMQLLKMSLATSGAAKKKVLGKYKTLYKKGEYAHPTKH